MTRPEVCTGCGARLDIAAQFCSACGQARVSTPPSAPSKRRLALWTIGSLVAGTVATLVTRAARHATPPATPVSGAAVRTTVVPGAAIVPTTVAGQQRIVVDATGQGDHRTLGAAIADATVGALIIVRPGVYAEAVRIRKDVTIVGEGDRARVILESDGPVTVTLEAERATIRNMTLRTSGAVAQGVVLVTTGKSTLADCDISSATGAGIFLQGPTSDPMIVRCTIHDCRGSGFLIHDQAKGTVEDCVIFGNGLSGFQIREGGAPIVRACAIRDGREGGIFVYDRGLGLIETCEIYGNTNSGVRIARGGNPVLRDCVIRDGKQAGVYVYEQGRGTIEKCDIHGNTNSGISVSTGGNPVVRDCGINNNHGPGVYAYDRGEGTFSGCTLRGNGPGAWHIEAGSTLVRTGNMPNA